MLFYTDGSCKTNPGPGGYACVLHDVKRGRYEGYYGFEKETTNNRMELMGMFTALEYISKKIDGVEGWEIEGREEITIFSDSQYVVKGINEWMQGWNRNGWKNAAKEAVKNPDIWQKIYVLYNSIKAELVHRNRGINIKWIKAHTITKMPQINACTEQNVVGNHLADILASCSAENISEHLTCECSQYLNEINKIS